MCRPCFPHQCGRCSRCCRIDCRRGRAAGPRRCARATAGAGGAARRLRAADARSGGESCDGARARSQRGRGGDTAGPGVLRCAGAARGRRAPGANPRLRTHSSISHRCRRHRHKRGRVRISAMKEYGDVLTGRRRKRRPRVRVAVSDVSEFLHALGLVDPPALREPLTVAYHDACHLAHAQGIRHAPRITRARGQPARLKSQTVMSAVGRRGSTTSSSPPSLETWGHGRRRRSSRPAQRSLPATSDAWYRSQPTWHEPERRGACSTRCRRLTRRIGCVRSTEAYPGQAVSASAGVTTLAEATDERLQACLARG